ncbi:hypothetical protein [Promicromonospora iranensis]|uniref:Lipoprotein n=2 Tax=Promicromonospora iranensis TaxID=1105144 RepID=A0ABU2CU74_9MICO|nr:hypothetical protein [Promicromonospora iranensis]MDR7384882.1 hypothetical protein [Promicromonospora iranensis]
MAALATASVLALGLSGCGAAASGPGEASDATASAQPPAPVELTQASFVDDLSAAQSEAGTVHMTMTYSGAGAEAAGLAGAPLEADVDISDPKNPAMAMQMELEGEATDMVLVDGDFYMKMGESTSGKYLSLAEAGKSDNPMAPLFQGMGDLMQSSLKDMDPSAQLQGMDGAITSFEKTGTETVDGVETDVYTILVDATKMSGPQVDSLPEEALAQVGEMEIVYNVGEDNLARKLVLTMGADADELVMSSTFSGWGEPVDVAAPSGDELTTLDEMMELTTG